MISKFSFYKKWEFILLLLVFIELFGFGLVNNGFLNLNNLLYSANDFVHIIFVALPFTLIVITGQIDVSIGSIMGLVSIVLGILWKYLSVSLPISIVLSLILGSIAGLLNGLLVAYTDINSLVLTLATMFLYQGIASGLSGSIGASGYNGIGGFPEIFTNISSATLFGIPYPFIFSIIFAVILITFLNRTLIGRSIYLIGANKDVALFSGIKVKKNIIIPFIITGFGSAFSGIFLTSYFTSARSDLGKDVLMPALTAVVLGGTSIYGGSGSILGTFIAAIFIGYMKQGLMAIGVTSDVSQVMVGLILIATVIVKEIVAKSALEKMNKLALKKNVNPNI